MCQGGANCICGGSVNFYPPDYSLDARVAEQGRIISELQTKVSDLTSLVTGLAFVVEAMNRE